MVRRTREEENGCCEEHDDERVEHHHHKYQDICAPGQDGEVIFNKNRCLSTDQRFIWDYRQGLLTIDGRFASSGYISSGSQIEGAYFAPQALGLGSFAFTPPSGYGGIVYRGGSIFYYWNDDVNAWEEVDFGPVTQEIDVAHNGVLIGTRSVLNFQDSVSVTWTIDDPGTFINISASDGSYGPWQENQNANGWSIYNLYQLNGVNVSDYLTKLWNQNVNANNYDLTNVGNLSVNGQIYYKGQTLEEYLQSLGIGGGDLWSLNPDGSIYRQSKVYVYGPDPNPMEIISASHTNFLYLNVTDAFAEGYCAYAAKTDGQYFGELGFSFNQIELWHNNGMVFTAIGNQIYFPGMIGIGIAPPQIHYPLDVDGDIHTSGCILIGSKPLSICASQDGNTLLVDGNAIGAAPSCALQSPWLCDIYAANYKLNKAGNIGIGTYAAGLDNIGLWIHKDIPDGQPSAGSAVEILIENNAPTGSSGFTTINRAGGEMASYCGIYATGPNYVLASLANCGVIYSRTDLVFEIGTGLLERMRITGTGNVGIGTSNPTYKLDVSGNANISGRLNVIDTVGIGTFAVGNTPLAVIKSDVAISAMIYAANVAPTAYSSIQIENDTQQALRIALAGSQVADALGANNTLFQYPRDLAFFNSQVERMRITSAGNVGIGKFPAYPLDVRGSVNAEGYLRSGVPMMLLTVEEHKGIFDKLNEMDSLMRIMRQRMDI